MQALKVAFLSFILQATNTFAASRIVRVGVYDNPPKILLGADHQPSGIFGDLLKEIARRENWTLQTVSCDWQSCLDKLKKGQIDLMPDVAQTVERDKEFNFNTIPVLYSWSAIYAPRDSHFKSILDLKGKRIAVLADSTQYTYLRGLLKNFGIKASLVPVAKYNQGFALAAEGQANGAVSNNFYGEFHDAEYKLVETPILFQPTKLFFAAGRGRHTDLLEAIDRHLKVWVNENRSPYFETRRKWLSEASATVLPTWWPWVLGSLLAVIVLVLSLNALLRRKVRQQTDRLEAELVKQREIDAELNLQTGFLRTLISTIPDLVWLKDPDGVFLACNSRFEALYGVGENEIIGKTDADFIDKDQAERFRQNDLAAMAAGNSTTNEEWLTFADGYLGLFETTKTPMIGQDGRVVGVLGIAHDITEQFKSRETLIKNEQQLKMAMQVARQGWFELNPQTGEVWVSDEYPRLIGYEPEKFNSSLEDWFEHVHPDDRPVLKEAYRHALACEEVTNMQYRRLSKQGAWVWIESIGKVVERDTAGRPTRMVGLHMDITERKEAEQQLEQLNADLSATLLAIPDLLFEISEAGEYINVWARNPELLATQKEILLGHTVNEILPDEAAEIVMSAIRVAVTSGTSFGEIIALDLADGRHWFELSTSAKSPADHGQHTFMMLSRDITERVKADESLRESEQRYRTLLSATGAVTWFCPPSGLHDRPQPQWMAFTGQSEEEMLGSGWMRVIHPDDLAIASERWLQAVETHQPYSNMHRIRRSDGEWRWMSVYAVPILNAEEELIEWFGMNLDITERKEAEERIEHLAFHDSLTGLANRALFLDRLTHELAVARRTQRHGAIIFIDLDLFKKINDVFGHIFGDKVLKEAADNLRQLLRESDTVARFGGDEFVILLPELSDDEETAVGIALRVAEKVRTALKEVSWIDGQSYSTTASIGISLFPRQHETVDDLIREADIAMYQAKERGRDTLVFFEDDMQAAISERFAMEQALREAIRENGLQLFLQSQVDSAGKAIGAEALVRWLHPIRGMIMPATFIPLAEEMSLIGALGEWVLRETCQLIVRLTAMGSSLRLAVNVSPRQFHQANFVARVKDILAETGADPVYLTLEITESLLLERTSEVVSRMLALTELGIRFSIDDFGTGYSSLSYLKRLPLNELKIDKSFVQDIPQDGNDVALVETILSMAHHLGFEVVAEGVETEEQFAFLTARQCEHFQGYLFHRPQPVQAWLASIETGPS